MQSGFSLWSFGRAYLELYFDLCFDFLFFNKIYETSLLQEFCMFYSHLTTSSGGKVEIGSRHSQTEPHGFQDAVQDALGGWVFLGFNVVGL